MKTKGKLLTILLAVIVSVSAVACTKQVDADSYTSNLGSYEVWGVDNLVNVIQSKDYDYLYTKKAPKLDFAMAKNENEYAQIIITPNYNVKNFELITSDLNSGSNVLPKEDIQVFVQKYVFCNDKTQWQGYMPIKNNVVPFDVYYPDMLMYQDVAKEFGENIIKANDNQGITVFVKTSPETPAGVYTGNFTLKVDGKTSNIPVSVTVWDFALGNATGKTLFYPQQLGFMNTEFDNTDDLYRTYYELCLEYNINFEYLPGFFSFKRNTDSKQFIEELKRYYDNPNFTCFSLPNYELAQWGVMTDGGKELLKEFMLEVCRACTKDGTWYIEKMTLNHDSLDEPQNSGSENRIKILIDQVNAIEEEVITTLIKEDFFKGWGDEKRVEFCNILRNMPQIVTTDYHVAEDYYTEQGINFNLSNVTFCPTIDNFDNDTERNLYVENAEKGNLEQWWYTCNQPQFPYPSHFTEELPVGNRVLRWMQYKYDITGYLYWGVNYEGSALRNPYKETKIWALNPNGDGYFFYAGRAYDSLPFPTVKLLSFSDGQEDMDMLYLLEDEFLRVASIYGYTEEQAKAMLDDMINSMMDTIIDGTTYNFDYTQLLRLREEVAQLILMLKNDELACYSITGDKAKLNVLSKTQNIKVNDVEVSGEEITEGLYKYSENKELSKTTYFAVETEISSCNLFVSKTRKTANLESTLIKSNDTVVPELDAVEGIITFTSLTKADDITFYPKYTLNSKIFGGVGSMADIDNVTFDYTNNSDEDYVIKISASKNSQALELDTFNVKAGETKRISLALIYNNQHGLNYTRNIGKTDSLQIVVYNQSGKELSVQIKNICYTLKEGK